MKQTHTFQTKKGQTKRLKPAQYKSEAIVQEQFGSKLTRNHCITIPDRLQSIGPYHIWGQVSLVTSELRELSNCLFNMTFYNISRGSVQSVESLTSWIHCYFVLWPNHDRHAPTKIRKSLKIENNPCNMLDSFNAKVVFNLTTDSSSISMPTLKTWNYLLKVSLIRSDLVPCWKHWNSVSILPAGVKHKHQQDSCKLRLSMRDGAPPCGGVCWQRISLRERDPPKTWSRKKREQSYLGFHGISMIQRYLK